MRIEGLKYLIWGDEGTFFGGKGINVEILRSSRNDLGEGLSIRLEGVERREESFM